MISERSSSTKAIACAISSRAPTRCSGTAATSSLVFAALNVARGQHAAGALLTT
jgi:hypothetical protein